MCGIVGFLDTRRSMGREELAVTVRRMATSLRHRGPEDEGTWVDPQHGIALGHRRLSIIDLSPAGHQPMHSFCGRYVITFNGEIYNFKALREELEALGQEFRGHSDTEVMLAAISHWGLDTALEKFNGMFAFALWDRKEKSLHFARDRAGEKPLYYGWAGTTLLFASELKAFRRHPSFEGEIDRDVLGLYLRHNYIPAPYSIYKGVYKLPAAARMTLRCSDLSISIAPYWSARQAAERGVANPFRGTEAEAIDQLNSLLTDSIVLRMVADVPLGAFLSGGVDSSVVVSLMQASSNRPVKTFTIGFHESEYNEAVCAKAVAQHLGTEHTELYVTPKQTMAVIPDLPTFYDEPFADSSQIPTYLVSRLARTEVTVSLSGDGGDELFGGYNSYFWGRSIRRATGWMPRPLRAAVGKAIGGLAALDWNGVFARWPAVLPDSLQQRDLGKSLQKLARVLRVDNPEALYWVLCSYWLEPASVVLGTQEPPTAFTDRRQWARLNDFVHTMMYLDTITYLPDDILVKVDRASMAVSLEARVPILDHRVIEFAWQLPLSMKINGNRGKEPLRKLLYRYVPQELVDRPKQGFAVPVHKWLRGALRPWAEDLLDESRLRREEFFRVEPIRCKWEEHLRGRHNWLPQLWGVLMFQAWLREQETSLVSKFEGGPPLGAASSSGLGAGEAFPHPRPAVPAV
ncbi:MAG: asparagine synthase (glutamine-hydrolyzing) [Acidobacteria bacterium]|nr:asparagine synthase (glutamine-hydrolyzing) [Acidobacteriota bacterium]